MKLIVKESFSWAHRGVDIQAYAEGEEIDTEDQDLVEVSTREGWAAVADQGEGEQGDKQSSDEPAAPAATRGRAKK